MSNPPNNGVFNLLEAVFKKQSITKLCQSIRRTRKDPAKSKTEKRKEEAITIAHLFAEIKTTDPSILDYKLVDNIRFLLNLTPLEFILHVDSQPHQQAILRLYITKYKITPTAFLHILKENDENSELIYLTMTLLSDC